VKNILIAYTTNSGTTEEVARAIGEELDKKGNAVRILRLEEVTSLEGYQAVVVGGPMILGWHRAAQKFVRQHRQELAKLPVAYFFTAMRLTQTGESQVGGVPLSIDPYLATPPAKPNRLSLAERYATPANYLQPALKAAPEVKPVGVGFFGGRLDMYRLRWWQALFVMVVIRAQPGDKRDWDFIRGWAAGLKM
jgi:menaquinone-dependent protoporphyrinogen IX oxidase